MKKNTIKLALVGILLASTVSIGAMGRFTARVGDKVAQSTIVKSVYAKFPKVSIAQVQRLNKETKERASKLISWIGGKGYTEKLLENMQAKVKEGIVPSLKNLCSLDQSCVMNNHGVLNLPDKDGHTLLKYTLDGTNSLERRKFIKALYARGAKLNNRDTYVMGPDKTLKAYLNVSLDASARTTVKVYRTLLTKNTEEKIQRRISTGNMSELEARARLKKVANAKEIYSRIEFDLLTRREKEFLQDLRDKRMPV